MSEVGKVVFGGPVKGIYKGVGGSREDRDRYGGFVSRVAALLIDTLIVTIPSYGLGYLTGYFVLFFIAIQGVYTILFNSSPLQATPGKRLCGLIITDYDNKKLSFQQATKRHMLILLIIITFGFGYLAQLWTDHKQTNQDLVARTLIVKKAKA